MSKIRVEATRRESTSRGRQPRKHPTYCRCECESIFSMHIHDRFKPETVADHENDAATKITDRDREHAAEPLQEVNSPMFVCMQNELGIGTSAELKPFLPQHGGIRTPVVDFAVVGDPDIAGA